MARPKKSKPASKTKKKKGEPKPAAAPQTPSAEAAATESASSKPAPKAKRSRQAASKTRSRQPGWYRYLPLIIVVLGFAAYQTSFDGVFVFDDENFIRDPQVIAPQSFAHVVSDTQRPLVNLSLAFNHSQGGLEPTGYHLFNLTVHLLAGLTLFGLARRLFARVKTERVANAATGLAGALALLWVVHPLQTQAVTYVIQRAESMMGLFYLLTLYCVVRSVDSRKLSARWQVAAVVACALGMWSKPIMMTAPLVALVLDWVFLAESGRELKQARWRLHAGLASTWLLLVSMGILDYFKTERTGTVGLAVKTVSPSEYLVAQAEVIFHYLRLSLWPHPLCLDYQWEVPESFLKTLPHTVVLALLFLWTCRAVTQRSPLGFVGAWFFLILGPTSSVMPVQDLLVEHRMYLPLAAPLVLLLLGGQLGLTRLLEAQPPSSAARKWGATALVGLLAGLAAFGTSERNKDYHSRILMWENVIEQRPLSWRGHGEHARAVAEDLGRHEEAVELYRHAISLNPKWAIAHYNLANSLRALGRHQEAIAENRLALQYDEDHPQARINLGRSLMDVGNHEEAAEVLEQAVTGEMPSSDRSKAYNNLGLAHAKLKRYAEAAVYYKEAIRIDPSQPHRYVNLGIAYSRGDDFANAERAFRDALSVNPNQAVAHYWLGKEYVRVGRLPEGIRSFEEALRIDPNYTKAQPRLDEARALLEAGH